jgi:hypothetical protein
MPAEDHATRLREMAEECRTIALVTKAAEVRTELVRLAEGFERLARLHQYDEERALLGRAS